MKKIIPLLLIAIIWKTWGGYNTPDFSNIVEDEVVLFSTSWCGYCEKTRRLFEKFNVPYTEYDIETSAEGKKKYDVHKKTGVPVIEFGDKIVMNGYDEKRITYYLGKLN